MNEGDLEQLAREAEGADAQRSGDEETEQPGLVVVRMDDEDEDTSGEQTEIELPGRLLRIATMVQRVLNELRDLELDEPGRRRLAATYARTLEGLGEVLSGDLRDELSRLVAQTVEGETPPSKAELQLVHAQLVGWLEGLFHGIQASIASQQMTAQQQLAHLARERQAIERDRHDRGPGGTYL